MVESTDGLTLQEFVLDQVVDGAKVYTDDHRGYHGLPNHQSVKHSVGEYVDGMAHTNGIESFWAMLKRGYHGTYHKMSAKHLDRYVNVFAGRHNQRSAHTADQMGGCRCSGASVNVPGLDCQDRQARIAGDRKRRVLGSTTGCG